eukprot:tig00021035_g17232.t1
MFPRGGCDTHVLAAPDLPYTRNLKKAEVAVKRALEGLPVPNVDSLANPHSLAFFRSLRLTELNEPSPAAASGRGPRSAAPAAGLGPSSYHPQRPRPDGAGPSRRARL